MAQSAKPVPTLAAFETYCQRYPLCRMDYSFMKRHRYLSKVSDLYEYPCPGCPECVFGGAYDDLNDVQKQYFQLVPSGPIYLKDS